MKNELFKIIATVAIIFSGCANHPKPEQINIACNLPMTGYIGVYGEWIKNGMDFYLQENKDTLNSIDISFAIDYQDNKGEVKDAINIVKRQLLDNPQFYLSGLTSQTMAVLDMVDKNKINHILWSFTPLKLQENKNQYRTWVNYGTEAEHYVEFCKSLNPQKIAILFINLQGAKDQCNEVVVPELKRSDSNIDFLIEEFPVGQSDFKSSALKIKKFNPEVILVSGFKDNIINILKDFETYNIDKSKMMCSMDLLDAANDLPASTIESIKVVSPIFNIPDKQGDLQKKWTAKFQEKYKKKPVYTEAYAYDMMNIITSAVQISKKENISLNKALMKINKNGVTGNLVFSQNGELKSNTTICQYRNGKLETKIQ